MPTRPRVPYNHTQQRRYAPTFVPLTRNEKWTANFPLVGYLELRDLTFMDLRALRRLTFRSTAYNVLMFKHNLLLMALPTLESTFFCELVFELFGPVTHHPRYYLDWGRWEGIDTLLGDRFAKCEDFRLVFRIDEVCGREAYQKYMRDSLPSLQERGRIHFE